MKATEKMDKKNNAPFILFNIVGIIFFVLLLFSDSFFDFFTAAPSSSPEDLGTGLKKHIFLLLIISLISAFNYWWYRKYLDTLTQENKEALKDAIRNSKRGVKWIRLILILFFIYALYLIFFNN